MSLFFSICPVGTDFSNRSFFWKLNGGELIFQLNVRTITSWSTENFVGHNPRTENLYLFKPKTPPTELFCTKI